MIKNVDVRLKRKEVKIMTKRTKRLVSAFLLVVMLISISSVAMAATLNFKTSSGSLFYFDSSNTYFWVGPGRQNYYKTVSLIQAVNNTYSNLPAVSIDGAYGNQTHSAIRYLQANYGITVDGDAGTTTWSYIHNARGTHTGWLLPFFS